MSERKVIRISAEAMKQVKELAKLYGIPDGEAADKAINTASSRLASLRKYSAKSSNGASRKPRTKKAAKKTKKRSTAKAKKRSAAKAKKTTKKRTVKSKSKSKSRSKSKKSSRRPSLADRARAARG
jgi:hypothetical protein